MIYYENILKRAKNRQIKEGISYPQKDGKLYNFFKFFYVVAFIFANIWSLLYILGAIIFSEEMLTSSDLPNFITVSVCTLIMFLTLIALKFNDNLIAAGVFGSVNVAGAVVLSETFFQMQKYSKVGIQLSYYWRHLVPFMIVCVAAIGLTVIIFGAYFKTKKAYNKVLEMVYETYNSLPENEKPDWEEYVKSYEFDKKHIRETNYYNQNNTCGQQNHYSAKNGVIDADVVALIGKKQGYYIPMFQKIKFQNKKIIWNWAAFLFPVYWHMYRKMYGSGFAFLFVQVLYIFIMNGYAFVANSEGQIYALILSFLFLCVTVVTGLFSNINYMKWLENKAKQAKSLNEPLKTQFIRKNSGVDVIAVVLTIIGLTILGVIICAFSIENIIG